MNLRLLGSDLPRNARVPFVIGQICGCRKLSAFTTASARLFLPRWTCSKS